jgi:hypothetical protein
MEIHTVGPLVPESSPFEVEIAIAKLKRYRSLGNDQILAELIQAGGETLCSEINKFINPTWTPLRSRRSLLLYQFTRVVRLTSNYQGISLCSTSHKILSNILLSRLSPCIDEIIGDYLCRFQYNRSATDQIFLHLSHIGKKWGFLWTW